MGGVLQGLVVPSEVLEASPECVVTFLLHEAAHVLNWTRGIKDTATRGYYHNEAYLQAAQEIGLEWSEERERDRTRGYPHPVMSEATRARHAADVKALSEIIPTIKEQMEPASARPKRAARPSFSCGGCKPPRRIWAAQSTMDLGDVVCSVCGQSFT